MWPLMAALTIVKISSKSCSETLRSRGLISSLPSIRLIGLVYWHRCTYSLAFISSIPAGFHVIELEGFPFSLAHFSINPTRRCHLAKRDAESAFIQILLRIFARTTPSRREDQRKPQGSLRSSHRQLWVRTFRSCFFLIGSKIESHDMSREQKDPSTPETCLATPVSASNGLC